ncbi:MAG: hypothetical protein GEU80_08595 [Dehalococcoidia bacterium]|nr:hypothetical protein [Dehalococcoidia bacterium]
MPARPRFPGVPRGSGVSGVLRDLRHVSALVVGASALILATACTSSPEPEIEVEAAPEVPPNSVVAVAATVTPTPVPRSVTLAAVGDLMLDRDVEALMLEHGAGYPFERVLPLLEADLLVGNLEGTFTERWEGLDKFYTFNTAPELADGLALAGFDGVSLANNHATDYGVEGLRDTLETLEAADVGVFGAGAGRDSAEAPLLLEANGLTVALLGFSDIDETIFADDASMGVAKAEVEAIGERVEQARSQADFVVVMLHAGTEYVREPTSRQRELARSAIDAGAGVVVGHHPHVVQPWERYRDGIILYSLGNFVFDLDAEDLDVLGSGPFESAVAVFTLTEGVPPEVEFRATYIDVAEVRPRPASSAEAAAVLEVLAEPSAARPVSR